MEFDKDAYKVNNFHAAIMVKTRRENNLYFLNVNVQRESDNYWKQLENKQEMKASRFVKWNNCIN